MGPFSGVKNPKESLLSANQPTKELTDSEDLCKSSSQCP